MAIEPEKPRLSLQSGANLTQLKKDVKKLTDGINSQKLKRKEINDQIASYRAKLETMGIHKKAADMAMAYMSWEPEKREGFDIAYAIVREAMGLPVSDDLFAHANEQDAEAARRAQQTEADAVFAQKAGLGEQTRDEAKVETVTASELSEADRLFAANATRGENGEAKPPIGGEPEPNTAPAETPITEAAPPGKKPGKMAPIVDDAR